MLVSYNRYGNGQIGHKIEVQRVVKGLDQMENKVCEFLQLRLVDIELVSASDFQETQSHPFLNEALAKVVFKSINIVIVNLANDSESQKILNNVAWIGLLAYDEHVDNLCAHSSDELHESH